MAWKDKIDASEWKKRLAQLMTKLQQERDDLRLKAHLAKMEAKDEMEHLEGKWKAFKSSLADVDLDEVKEDAWETANNLAAELKEGYSKLKERIKQASQDGTRP